MRNIRQVLLDYCVPDRVDLPLQERWDYLMATADQRTCEVAQYIEDAALSRLGVRGTGGTLKFVLWWLKDNLNSLEYERLAALVIGEAIEYSWPLEKAWHHLRRFIPLAQYADALDHPESWEDIAKDLMFSNTGKFSVAYNNTKRNLAKAAFRSGADVYIAITRSGTRISTRRGLVLSGLEHPWFLPYPNMALTKEQKPIGNVLQLLSSCVQDDPTTGEDFDDQYAA